MIKRSHRFQRIFIRAYGLVKQSAAEVNGGAGGIPAEYAEAIGVTPEDWQFFTGDRQALWDLSIEGFKLEVADTPDDPVNPILHSGKVILIDREGMIRGFYEGLVPEGMAQLQADLRRLLEE